MVYENRLQQLAQKQTWLENELSQRPRSPQLGDIFIFIYSGDELGLQWVILDKKDSQFFIVPADDTPMVGSMDIDLPDSALCSPLTLRCDLGVWVEATDFDLELRVGVLEEWHRRRALERVKQISEKTLKIQFQTYLIQFLKFWHRGLPKMLYRLVGDIASVGSVLYQEMNYQPAYLDFKQQLNNERRALRRTLSTTTKSTKPISKNRFDWTWKAGWAIAVVLMLAVSLKVFWPPENKIDSSYHIIRPSSNSLIGLDARVWKGTASEGTGFSSYSPQVSSSMKAFAAGLWNGQQDLLSSSPTGAADEWLTQNWSTTDWATYFELGRWIFLLETVSESVFQSQYQVPNGFWEQQRLILADFNTDFEKRQQKYQETEAVEIDWVMSRLEEYIEPLLKQLPDDSSLYGKLANELKDMREGLAPTI